MLDGSCFALIFGKLARLFEALNVERTHESARPPLQRPKAEAISLSKKRVEEVRFYGIFSINSSLFILKFQSSESCVHHVTMVYAYFLPASGSLDTEFH